ncbi:hypothetical protein C8J57DRAFT_1210241 [Mycena rebaudengoi]|nr:hypothetical protein C8J57DRAFT_1210241 [Mycena rebaudengoi]
MAPPRTISYALFFPALILNLVVFGALGYAISSAIQDGEPGVSRPRVVQLSLFVVIDTEGEGSGIPVLGLVFAGLESLYIIIAIILTFAHVSVPSLAAILVNSLYLIPCYIGGTVSLGIIYDYFRRYFGACNYRGISDDDCHKTYHKFVTLQLIGMIFQLLGLVLIVVDLVRVIRIHRTGKKNKNGSV